MCPTPEGSKQAAPQPSMAEDASRRTHLANERTQLAWWRTGLASIAVGLAIGKVIPQLSDDKVVWPYTVLGAGFALYGLLLMVFGARRREQVTRSLMAGGFAHPTGQAMSALTAIATVLAAATVVLIIVD